MKYRVTFTSRDGRGRSKKYDLEAESMDKAEKTAYQLLKGYLGYGPEYAYSDCTTEEIPEGITGIGVRFEYLENGKRTYTNYLSIRANGESDAIDFYNKNIKGKRFYQPWPHKIDENGNCVYGKVVETYFIGDCDCVFDATKAV